MRKIINDPAALVDEMIEGILLAFPYHYKRATGTRRGLLLTQSPVPDKVAICTGGGSGHLPLFLGYVGAGLADGVSIGNVFSAPSAQDMLAVVKAAHARRGALFLYGNYTGDVMNFDMAAEMADMEGIQVASVTGADDVASAPKEELSRRRGIAGICFAYKVAGAAAAEGYSLDQVKAVAEKAVANTRSMGVALSGTTIPTVGKPGFTVPDGEMELGMGIHGEPGIRQGPLLRADEIADVMLDHILKDLPFKRGDNVAVLVNTLGATAPEEGFLLYRKAHQILDGRGISVPSASVGEFATSMEMAGASLSLMRLDDQLLKLLRAPFYSPLVLPQFGRPV